MYFISFDKFYWRSTKKIKNMNAKRILIFKLYCFRKVDKIINKWTIVQIITATTIKTPITTGWATVLFQKAMATPIEVHFCLKRLCKWRSKFWISRIYARKLKEKVQISQVEVRVRSWQLKKNEDRIRKQTHQAQRRV